MTGEGPTLHNHTVSSLLVSLGDAIVDRDIDVLELFSGVGSIKAAAEELGLHAEGFDSASTSHLKTFLSHQTISCPCLGEVSCSSSNFIALCVCLRDNPIAMCMSPLG